jgi:hypothetical protein
MGSGVPSPGVKNNWGVTLTTHPHVVTRSRMSRSYTFYSLRSLHDIERQLFTVARNRPQMSPQSPDCMHTDFFFWEIVEAKMYSTSPQDVDDMNGHITEAFTEFDLQK